jgi:hypothetical protein
MGSFCRVSRVDADDDPCLESDEDEDGTGTPFEVFSRALVTVVKLFAALAPAASTPSPPFIADC